jgi:hypothetical protein
MPRASGNFCSPLVWNLFCAAQWYEDLVTDRIVNEFGEGMQAKLEHDFRPVRLQDTKSLRAASHLPVS